MDLQIQDIDQEIVKDLMERFIASGLFPPLESLEQTSEILKKGIVDIIGRPFFMVSYHGSHEHKIAGTIIGFDVSDEGFHIELHVSTPTFWVAPLCYLGFSADDDAWHVITKSSTTNKLEMFPIALYLL